MATPNISGEIAILDFGSQYTHLIARRIRGLGVLAHIYPNDVAVEKLGNAVGVILSGGPKSVVTGPQLSYPVGLFELKIPILGLCYGHQLMAKLFGGEVAVEGGREYGLAQMHVKDTSIFKDVPDRTEVWMSHGDHVLRLPEGFREIAQTENGSITAMTNEAKKWYGFQFHPEVHHTRAGKQMLSNFVFDICVAQKNWLPEKMLAEMEEDIRNRAGDKKIFLLMSGGVDSTVCFVLLNKILGKDRVYALYVDHGLMRQEESQAVDAALRKIGVDNLHVYHAEDECLQKLAGVADPEQKRKIIGDLFLDITERVMAEQAMDIQSWLVGQGTIYPDTIESGGTKNADLIKTHHNRVPRIQIMIEQGQIIEPLRELYKDEVREMGLQLKVPPELIYRHPFPGPGLGIRCLCSVGEDTLPVSMPNELGLELYQLPVRSVGVQGDERSYAHPALIVPDKTAAEPPWSQLRDLAPKITNSYKHINRVLYCLSGETGQLASATLEQAYVTKDRLDILRTLDAIVNKYVMNSPACKHIWQMPVVLIPFGHHHRESVVLRPVETEDVMTLAFAALPEDILNNILKEIRMLDVVDFVFYDVTNKPPGTLEWE